ncbi:hypothetical protein [Microvirga roseola]|uniref:hypothetical protein n=1 Tax=Microvirga roseola TaxID=2883126 RepID=UPI001E644358|nr:hypothetical protein [Microvirga roseola]
MNRRAGQVDLFFAPGTEQELLKIREELRSEAIERRKLAFEKYADQLGQERIHSQSFSKEHGQTFIKSVFLLNGGAILALLTFIGSMYGKNDLNVLAAISLGKKIVPAFYCFAIGLCSAALVALIGFFNWNLIANSYPGPGPLFDFLHHKPIEEKPATRKAIGWTYRIAIVLAALSIGCFVGGANLVTTAFSVLGID